MLRFFGNLGAIAFKFFFQTANVAGEFTFDHFLLGFVLGFQLFHGLLARGFVDVGNNEVGKVDDFFKRHHRHVEHGTNFRRHAAQEPNVRDRSSQINVAHAFTSHNRVSDFHTTLITDDSFIANLLVFATVTLPVFRRPENFFRKQSALFWLLRAVVNRFWFFDVAIRPAANRLRRGQAQTDGIKVRGFEYVLLEDHRVISLMFSCLQQVRHACRLSKVQRPNTTPSAHE